jgi:hypothetical protein
LQRVLYCCRVRYRQAVDRRKSIESQIKDVHRQLDVGRLLPKSALGARRVLRSACFVVQMSEDELAAIERELTTIRSKLESEKIKYNKLRGSIETV